MNLFRHSSICKFGLIDFPSDLAAKIQLLINLILNLGHFENISRRGKYGNSDISGEYAIDQSEDYR